MSDHLILGAAAEQARRKEQLEKAIAAICSPAVPLPDFKGMTMHICAGHTADRGAAPLRQSSLLTRAANIRASLASGESARKIVRALVADHGARCHGDGDGWEWTLGMLGIRVTAPCVNAPLLLAWCDAAEAKANRPRLRDRLPRIGLQDATLCFATGEMEGRLIWFACGPLRLEFTFAWGARA